MSFLGQIIIISQFFRHLRKKTDKQAGLRACLHGKEDNMYILDKQQNKKINNKTKMSKEIKKGEMEYITKTKEEYSYRQSK